MFETFDYANPTVYNLGDQLSKRTIRYLRSGNGLLPFDNRSRRYAKIGKVLNDRSQFVRLGHSRWWNEGTKIDLSVDVLENSADSLKEYFENRQSVHFSILASLIETNIATMIGNGNEYRQGIFHRLLRAYFTATTELDGLYRSEPAMSETMKQTIIEQIKTFAHPTRTLLLEMADRAVRGNFDYDRFEQLVCELTESWQAFLPLDSETAQTITSRSANEFETQQADTRIRIFLSPGNIGM